MEVWKTILFLGSFEEKGVKNVYDKMYFFMMSLFSYFISLSHLHIIVNVLGLRSCVVLK